MLWTIKEEATKTVDIGAQSYFAAYEQLLALAQHLYVYKAVINSLTIKDNRIEIDIIGDIPKGAEEHLNIEIVK